MKNQINYYISNNYYQNHIGLFTHIGVVGTFEAMEKLADQCVEMLQATGLPKSQLIVVVLPASPDNQNDGRRNRLEFLKTVVLLLARSIAILNMLPGSR